MSIRYTADQLQRKFAGTAGAPGYARVADAFRAEGRLEEAIGLCREGLRTRPMVAGYTVLGKTLVEAGNLEDAREQFEAALRLDPRCLSALHALAAIMGRLQWADAAAGYYRSILELEPWDAEIRALLEGSANTGAAPGLPPAGAPATAEPFQPVPEEETFLKPDGLNGDVLEVNLNDVADEFLPSGGEDSGASLEDALGTGTAQASEGDFSPAPDAAMDRNAMDGLSTPPSGPETLGENAPAPISGSDVEERLDSLFGNEDGGTPSATATWTAAPAFTDGLPEASATATGELRALEAGPDAGFPAAPSHFELAEAPDMGSAAPPETGAGPLDEESRVQGEDIERRLDELFHLSGEDDSPKPAPQPASALPIAPAPRMGETVILGEAVPFGDRAIPFGDRKNAASGAEDDSGILEIPIADGDASAREAANFPAESEWVTGQDVVDKLDSLFEEPVSPAAAPFSAEKAPPEPGPGEALLSTESMLPPGWSGDAPQVTGADVEAQLDKLFNLEPSGPDPFPAPGTAPEAPAAAEPVPAALGAAPPAAPERNLDETVTFERPPQQPGAGEQGRLKESVADWLARQEDEPAAGDTMILPNEGLFLEGGPGAAAEAKAGDEIFGALAPEEIAGLSETASIEMVDGGDVAQRLDRLFSDGPGGPVGEVPIFEPEEPSLPEIAGPESELEPAMTLEMPIPELDRPGTAAEGPDNPPFFPAGTEGEDLDRHSASAAAPGAGPDAAGKAAPELAPMLDEEDGYPDEEEMPSEAAAANVATVTLAEIYFQQGLKEQALQIYRQLLEREPENESVRKRIAEIEASRSDTDRGPDSDPRRPRPGLKVPKRKK
jgi:pilus assembly protein FimV